MVRRVMRNSDLLSTCALGVLALIGATSASYGMGSKLVNSPAPSKQGFVVLIPGSGSSGPDTYIKNLPTLFANKYFRKYQDLLNAAGVDNLICPETKDDDRRSIEEREEECVQQILTHEKSRGQECVSGAVRDVVLMGHSMGGLIARELAQDPRVDSCIKTVLSVSTPHKGAVFADFAIDHTAKDDAGFDFYGKISKFIGYTPENERYLEELRADRTPVPLVDQSRVFHAQDIADNESIEYDSISSSFSNDLLDYVDPVSIMRAIADKEMKLLGLDTTSFGTLNDGVVPEYSQIHGKYLGHLEVTHFESACVDLVSFTPGCNKAAEFIIPILKSQVVL
jgi:pimeloyl-ACP methyl ester carboxylesterase